MLPNAFVDRLSRAVDARSVFFDPSHEAAFRLFNGFLEGFPDLVVDLYARTLLFMNYADTPGKVQQHIDMAVAYLLERLPWVQAVIVKTRSASDEQARRGVLVHGKIPSRKIRENGAWHAVDLTLNLDASIYLDTRNLRAWAMKNMAGKRVLNTFAYTGSLGTAAMAGGASQVVQTDLNRRFLNLAKDSYALNGFPVQRSNFIAADFWVYASQLRRAGQLFDCVFVDPPFFSTTSRGTVDLVSQSQQVINKARPLVGHGGWLVAINNALFLSGAEYLRLLEELCADGYMTIESLIDVPPDFAGFPETRTGSFPVDPAPFNHATKIAVLCVRRKDAQLAQAVEAQSVSSSSNA